MKKRNNNHIFLLFLFSMAILWVGCEQEDREVGVDVIGDNAAQLNLAYVDVEAFTVSPDTVRSDRGILANATVGAYRDPIFGKTKSSLYSQVRLNLGSTIDSLRQRQNIAIDSVVLEIPTIAFDSEDTLSVENIFRRPVYSITNTDEECTITDTLYQYEILRQFKLDSIYGNTDASITLQVHRVVESMKSVDSIFYSNREFEVGEKLGELAIGNSAKQREISNFTEDDVTSTLGAQQSKDASPVIRIRLDEGMPFFQNEILGQINSSFFNDQASFITNVLNGIRISVAEDDGFLLNINPSTLRMNMYYTYDNPAFVDENPVDGIDDGEEDCSVIITEPRIQANFSFNMANPFNVLHSHIENEDGNINYTQENPSRVYVEGMAGAKTIITLDEAQIQAIRDSVEQRSWAITEAHFKLYPATNEQGDLPLPNQLYLYNYDENELLDDYGGLSNEEEGFQGFPFAQISLPYDEEDGYYLLRITEQFKNIVEDNASNRRLALEMGNYLAFNIQSIFYTPQNAFFSNRVYNPYRLVLVGPNPEASLADQKIQLEVIYNKRN